MNKALSFIFLLTALQAAAVFKNPNGFGEVLLVPYYTVNQDLNTLVSVTNSVNRPKAIKVTFREGLHGYAVLSYNVYLDAFDTWTFALVSSTSTLVDFAGDPSVLHISNDTSCAPGLNKSGQEFLPFELVDGPEGLDRAREGFIEIMELGELTGDYLQAVNMGNVGVPNDCSVFDAAWAEGGQWVADPSAQLAPPSGGLKATADLINVNEGINYSMPMTALSDFYAADVIAHVAPSDTGLSLDAAQSEATIITTDGLHQLQFESGIDAVSAVLMKETMLAHYTLESVLAAKSALVTTQPTRRFYIQRSSTNGQAPFNNLLRRTGSCQDNVLNVYGGIDIFAAIFDRSSQIDVFTELDTGTPPLLPQPSICGSVFVLNLALPNAQLRFSNITGSKNYIDLTSPYNAADESGFAAISFFDTMPLIANDPTGINFEVHGIPIIGFSLFQYTNAGAGEGLLAQYGGSYPIKATQRISINQ